MIRILIFVLGVVFAAYVLTVLAGVEGRLTAQAFGQKFDFHTGGAAIILLGALVFAVVATSVVKDLRRLPKEIAARDRETRRTRGIEALTRGLEAVAVGDADSARHHAKVACRNLDESALTRLLTARAAYLAGDEAETTATFSAMLEAPETSFLGLHGLYQQAIRAGEKDAARDYAERAFRLRPNAAWAFESMLALGLERGAWRETRDAVKTAVKQKILGADKAKRAEAALLAADAYASADTGETTAALEEAEGALKLAPDLAPAAALAARLHAGAGRRERAARILEQAFADSGHPGLVAAHNRLYEDEPGSKRAEHMQKIAARKPAAREAKLQSARRALLLGEFADARTILEQLLVEGAYAGDFALMAEAVAGARGGEAGLEAGRAWLRRAAGAPRNPAPGADGEFHLTRDGWARLVREYMEFARLAPPPIEDAPPGISEEELKRLAPPEERASDAEDEAVAEPDAGSEADNQLSDDEEAVVAARKVN